MIRDDIHAAIKEELISLGAPEVSFSVDRPDSLEHGDYATNAAFSAAQLLKKNPDHLAQELVGYLRGKIVGVDNMVPMGGFVNFFLSREITIEGIQAAASNKAWGDSDIYEGKIVLVEYTSPNLFKPLHIGNLIGNILGESITRVLEHAGAGVKRLNYPSDIGLTVAKGVWGLWKNNLDPADIVQLGQAYVAGNEAYETNVSQKKEIEEINEALYINKNAVWSGLRKKGVETSRRHLDALCERLGTKFDAEFFESDSGPLGKDIVQKHTGSVFEESEGAVVYRGEQEGLHTRVFLNSQGLPAYEAKEIGLFELKSEKFPYFETSITVTGLEQEAFFKVVFAAVKKVFPEKTDGRTLRHIAHGFLRLTTGRMSSRKGNVISGESLLMDLREVAKGKMSLRELKRPDLIAEQVAVGAIKYAVLKQGRGKDIIFDPEKSLSLEGDSGPYLQYAHTRAHSLVQAAKAAGIRISIADAPNTPTIPERMLVHYPEVLARAARELDPHYVTTYLTELASAFNSWYASERVIGGAHPSYGLLLASAVEHTLSKGLQVLGIPAPEEM